MKIVPSPFIAALALELIGSCAQGPKEHEALSPEPRVPLATIEAPPAATRDLVVMAYYVLNLGTEAVALAPQWELPSFAAFRAGAVRFAKRGARIGADSSFEYSLRSPPEDTEITLLGDGLTLHLIKAAITTDYPAPKPGKSLTVSVKLKDAAKDARGIYILLVSSAIRASGMESGYIALSSIAIEGDSLIARIDAYNR
jgi:hypothetical protein